MREITLLNSKVVALVDDGDYERLAAFEWHINNRDRANGGYAARTVPGVGTKILMHHEVLAPIEGMQIDHINGTGLDNRRANLRYATRTEQMRNRGAYKRRKDCAPRHSEYKGVMWEKGKNKWRVRIKVEGRQKHVGLFESEVDAARAYNEAARRFFGDFARFNGV